MDRETFAGLLASRVLVCDGPLGAILGTGADRRDSIPEMLALEDAARLTEIHAASLEAGAGVIRTNTLAANRPTLEPMGLADRLDAIVTRSVEAARTAISKAADGSPGPLVALVLGPLSPGVRPAGALPFEAAVTAYAEVARMAPDLGVDLFMLEGITDLAELRVALVAFREAAPDLPVVVQLTFGPTGRTAGGATPASAWAVSRSLGADAVGACGRLTPEQMLPAATAFQSVSDLPLAFQPSCEPQAGRSKRHVPARVFARQAKALLERGTGLLGCWGAPSSEYVAFLRRMARGHVPALAGRRQQLVLASRGRDVAVGGERGIIAVRAWGGPSGERSGVGPEPLAHAVADEVRRGAVRMLEVRYERRHDEEPAFFEQILPRLSSSTDLPLLITAGTRRGLEVALQSAAGRPLVASVWQDRQRMEQFLPLIRRYGAAVVLTCMTAKGVPRGADERVRLAEKLIEATLSAGLAQEDLIIDPVLPAVRGDPASPREVLQTLVRLKHELGQPTMMRVSRLAEGRSAGRLGLETAFVAMAAAADVDLIVGDFGMPPLAQALAASAFLAGRDSGGRRYDALVEAVARTRGAYSRAPDRPGTPRLTAPRRETTTRDRKAAGRPHGRDATRRRGGQT